MLEEEIGMRRTLFVVVASTAAALVVAAVAYAAVTVSFSATASPNRAGKPTGLFYGGRFVRR